MSRDIALLLIGAAIAIASSIVTAIVQHRLNLRAERIKRRLEKEENESKELRERLIEGAQVQFDLVKKKVMSDNYFGEGVTSAGISDFEKQIIEMVISLMNKAISKADEKDKNEE